MAAEAKIQAPDLLREFLRLENIAPAELARRAKISEGYLSDLLNSLRRAGLEVSHRLETATRGMCPARAWLDFEPAAKRSRKPQPPPKRAA